MSTIVKMKTEHKIEFVSYDGEWPNLCRGYFIVKIDGKEYKFGRVWDDKDNTDILEEFWISGGSVTFDKDWNENVSSGPWELEFGLKKEKYPEVVQECLEDLIRIFNENVPEGCFGGCV